MENMKLENFGLTEEEVEKIAEMLKGSLQELREKRVLLRDVPFHESGQDFMFVHLYEVYNHFNNEPDVHPRSSKARELPSDWMDRAEAVVASKVGAGEARAMRQEHNAEIRKMVEAGWVRGLS